MDLFGRKRKRLEKARNDALHGVSCCYWPDTDERKEYNKTKQEIEDAKIEREISTEANKRFKAWVNAPVIKFGKEEFKSLPIFMPFMHIYNLHDESTAKFLHINTEDMVREEFNKLKANYCN